MSETIPDDLREAAMSIWLRAGSAAAMHSGPSGCDVIAEALFSERRAATEAERNRWKPAVVYFERYCQDEASDGAVEWVGCSEQKHEDAKAFAAVVREKKL